MEGSVGIGTAEPTAKLDVIGIAESNSIRSSSSAGGGYAAGNFTASGSGTYGIWAQSNDYDALYAWSQASGSAAIRALGTDGAYAGLFDGVVGINTSTPTNGMLDVAGIISSTTGGFRFPDGTIQTTAASGTGTGNTLDQAYDQGGAGIGRSIDADAGAVNITGSGGLNVGGSIGVGTTDPTARLDVIGISESNTIRANSSAGGGYAAGNFTASGSGTYGIWAQSNDYDAIYAWSQNSGSTAIRALGTDGAYAGLFDGVVGINTSNPENGMLEVTGGTMMSAIAANSSSLNTISSSCSSGGGYAAGNFTASGSGTYGIWAQSNDYDALYAWSQASGSTAIRALGTDGAYAGLFDGVVGINTSNPENGMLEVTGSGFMSAIAANSSSQNTISSDCSSGGGYAAGHFSATGGGTYAIWATSSEYDAIYATAGSSYDAIFANGNITYTGSLTHQSDIRLKENISPLENSLSKLMQLKVKSFYFKNDQQFAHVNFPKGKNFGFIAQEFEKVIPELVTDNINFSSGGDTGSEEESINYKGINYTELIPFLVQAIQEQQEMIDDLKAQVIELQDK